MIEVLIVVAILGILASFLVPNIVQALNKGRASSIVNDARIIRDTLLRYQIEKNSWPRSRGWGRIPPEFRSYLPPGAVFNIKGWDTSLAFTNRQTGLPCGYPDPNPKHHAGQQGLQDGPQSFHQRTHQ